MTLCWLLCTKTFLHRRVQVDSIASVMLVKLPLKLSFVLFGPLDSKPYLEHGYILQNEPDFVILVRRKVYRFSSTLYGHVADVFLTLVAGPHPRGVLVVGVKLIWKSSPSFVPSVYGVGRRCSFLPQQTSSFVLIHDPPPKPVHLLVVGEDRVLEDVDPNIVSESSTPRGCSYASSSSSQARAQTSRPFWPFPSFPHFAS